MPLGRPNISRSASRSPVPPLQSSSSPHFFPPSHYAAAGGIPLKKTKDDDLEFGEELKSPAETFIPTSLDDSIDNVQNDLAESKICRRFSISSFKSNFNATSPKTPTLKRQSQIGDLPSVEAALLPSLRDTVERMTKPLSRSNSRVTSSPSTTSFDAASIYPSSTITSTSFSSGRTSTDTNSLSSAHSLRYDLKPLSSKVSSKSCLKSALRTPKMSTQTLTPIPTSSFSKTKSSFGHIDRAESLLKPRGSRMRSRTDPGISFHSKTLRTTVSTTREMATTPQPSPTLMTPKMSSIPRRANFRLIASDDSDIDVPQKTQAQPSFLRTPTKTRQSKVPGSPAFHSTSQSSTSDIEALYAAEQRRLKRKLVVTNAEIVSSSSSDDAAALRGTKLPVPSSSLRSKPSAPQLLTRKIDEFAPNGLKGQIIQGFEIETEHNKNPRGLHSRGSWGADHEGLNQDEVISAKRRTALLGIVDGLHLERLDTSLVDQLGNIDSNMSTSQVGLAISESCNTKHSHSQESASRSEYEQEVGVSDWREYGKRLSKRVADYYQLESHQLQEPFSTISRVDSDISSAGSDKYWEDGENDSLGLSHGAEALFQNFNRAGTFERRKADSFQQDVKMATPLEAFHGLSESESAPSIYEDGGELSWTAENDSNVGSGFRSSTIAKSSIRAEQQLDLLRAFHSSETTYLSVLDSTISFFVLPLRIRDTRKWVSGVPVEISQLLDWLEDIRNIHRRLHQALSLSISTLPERPADSIIQSFVTGLEVYQPYIVRCTPALDILRASVADHGCDFGQFVRIQESEAKTSSFGGLEERLLEPLKRLPTYPLAFRNLLNLTEKADIGYVSAFCLVQATESIVKALNNVKIREDGYELIKSIERQLKGLPKSLTLATRERQLHIYGTLFISLLPASVQIDRDTDQIAYFPDRSTTPAQTLHNLEHLRRRSGSTTSNASSHLTFESGVTSSGGSSAYPVTPPPILHSRRSFSLYQTNEDVPYLGFKPAQVFAFSDLLVIADSSTSCVLDLLYILSVSEDKASLCIVLDTLPLSSLDDLPNCPRVNRIRLVMDKDDQTLYVKWISAFKSCCDSTLRFISLSIAGVSLSPADEIFGDTSSIVRQGLPFPKSPSIQVEERGQFQGDDTTLEREARGWWSLQFEKTLKSMGPDL